MCGACPKGRRVRRNPAIAKAKEPRMSNPLSNPSNRTAAAVRRVARSCALLLAGAAAALATPPAPAQDSPSVWVVPTAATPTTPPSGVANLIVVTPSSSATWVSNQLKSRPAGQRGVLLSGFANDLMSAEIIRRVASAPTVPVPSPWVTKGAANARSRVNLLMTRIKQQGAPLDFVVVRAPVSARADFYATYGAPGWRTIQADRRYTAVRNALGLTNLPVEMAGSEAMRDAWNAYFDAYHDTELHKAVVTTVRRYYPNVRVIGEGRYTLDEDGAVTLKREGAAFGSNDQPQFHLSGVDLEPFAALRAVVDDARAIAEDGGRAIVPSVSTASWASGSPPLRNSVYWNEQLYHLLLSGAQSVMVDRGSPTSGDIALIGAINAEVQTRLGGAPAAPHTGSTVVDGDVAVASAVRVGNTVHWRLSAAPDVTTLRVVFADETVDDVAIDPEVGGAWYSHPFSQQVAFIQAPPSGGDEGGGSGEAAHAVLFDVEPAVGFVNPVENSQKYLLVYQNAGDPNAGATGLINPASVIAEVQRILNTGLVSEYGVLDFEDPFDDILMTGPSHPQYDATMQSVVECIQAVKAAFPDMKWTYYGWPRIGYNPNGRDWAWWTEEQRETYYPLYTDKFAAVMNEMDWFMPSVYDKYERAAGLPFSYSPPTEAEQGFRRANVVAIRRFFELQEKPVPPIIPAVSPWFQNHEVEAYLKPIPLDEYCEDQLQPLFEAGADGVAIWGSMDHFIELATYSLLPLGYEAQTAMVRNRFALDYFDGVDVNLIDWYSAEVKQTVGDAINDTLEQALEAAAAGGVLGP